MSSNLNGLLEKGAFAPSCDIYRQLETFVRIAHDFFAICDEYWALTVQPFTDCDVCACGISLSQAGSSIPCTASTKDCQDEVHDEHTSNFVNCGGIGFFGRLSFFPSSANSSAD